MSSPLDALWAHLRVRPGVSVRRDGDFVAAVMRGKPTVTVVWKERAGGFVIYSGSEHGRVLGVEPPLVAEAVMMRLEAPVRRGLTPSLWRPRQAPSCGRT